MMQPLQRFDEQEIHRKPDRAAPIGIAAKQAGFRFARLIADLEIVWPSIGRINGMILVISRNGADAKRREKFLFLEDAVAICARAAARFTTESSLPSFHAGLSHGGETSGQIGTMLDEPLHPFFEAGALVDGAPLQRIRSRIEELCRPATARA